MKSEELISKKNYAEAKEMLNKVVSETKDNKNLEEYNKKALGLITKIGEEEKKKRVKQQQRRHKKQMQERVKK